VPALWLVRLQPMPDADALGRMYGRGARTLRSARPVEMPPHHVLRATVAGQRVLFERAGLEALECRVSEVAWPAPGKLTADVVRRPRSLGLFALRKVSQAVSALAPARWGNRYFLAGAARQERLDGR
jgi:hypothetical protein